MWSKVNIGMGEYAQEILLQKRIIDFSTCEICHHLNNLLISICVL